MQYHPFSIARTAPPARHPAAARSLWLAGVPLTAGHSNPKPFRRLRRSLGQATLALQEKKLQRRKSRGSEQSVRQLEHVATRPCRYRAGSCGFGVPRPTSPLHQVRTKRAALQYWSYTAAEERCDAKRNSTGNGLTQNQRGMGPMG